MGKKQEYIKAEKYFENKEYNKAMELYVKLYNKDYKKDTILSKRFAPCIYETSTEKRLEYIDQLIKANPDDAKIYFIESDIHLLNEDYEKGLNAINKACNIDSDNFEYAYRKIQIYDCLDKTEEGEKYLKDLKENHQDTYVKIYLFNYFLKNNNTNLSPEELFINIDRYTKKDIQTTLEELGGIENI